MIIHLQPCLIQNFFDKVEATSAVCDNTYRQDIYENELWQTRTTGRKQREETR